MADFMHQLEAAIETKKRQLAEMQAELDEMETAARVYRRLQGHGAANGTVETTAQARPVAPQHTSDALLVPRKSAREWALEILQSGEPMHYKEVAKEAMRRGFVSIQSSDADAPIRTFMSVLYRTPDLFKSKGKGLFMLNQQGVADEE